ncbi:AtfA [Verticillium alfalfae VaMs.102]|uniref:AtfA n=1 Tax=Verticillium alfalfae (strain VaMs.102 / ATCC MYA-4576 / FGSC 10136) TaxID=526221 RepID=C9S5P7_VERA1|nr:AtfA [Verticillium alfalfae VaMs.102]EEY14273.1 AtfA [Verticillium alfalfae VaMs.102]
MGTSPNNTSARGDPKSPKKSTSQGTTPERQGGSDSASDAKQSDSSVKNESDGAKPLGPPPRPAPTGNTPDYFGGPRISDSNLNLEPNPFEQSFGGGNGAETPGGTKLPSVAHITSPSALLPGTGTTPFNWGGGSLRTGPLSPAMLSGPTNDYFSDSHHLRGGFPTPNESSLRTGLTPGGSGSMFPAPSPNSQLFAQLAGSGATPGTLDFHRTALSAAAAAKREAQNLPQPSVTSRPAEMANGGAAPKPEVKTSGPFDPHDNDAANGLFMLAQGAAQGRNGAPTSNYPPTSQSSNLTNGAPAPAVQPLNTSPNMGHANGVSSRGVSEGGSAASEESEHARPSTRGGKGKRNGGSVATNGRRKAEEPPAKAPASKKQKTSAAMSMPEGDDSQSEDDEETHKLDENGAKVKMTDEEKRKNFLERNRWRCSALRTMPCRLKSRSCDEEVVNLKTLLLAHKDCPVTQQQGLHGAFMQQAIEPYNHQMNPYGMAGPMQTNQQVMAGGQGRSSSLFLGRLADR